MGASGCQRDVWSQVLRGWKSRLKYIEETAAEQSLERGERAGRADEEREPPVRGLGRSVPDTWGWSEWARGRAGA